MSLELDTGDFLAQTALAEQLSELAVHDELENIGDDLIRISSNIAPISTGTLRKSHSKEVLKGKNGHSVEIAFSAIEDSVRYGMFNYALWTHEMEYDKGPRSAAASGTDGYEVGNKYLERPLYGESEKYLEWLGEAIKRSVER
jgi:hypothetical protein